MALFDITLLTGELSPVAAGTATSLYAGVAPGLSPTQLASAISGLTPAASGVTDAAGHFQVDLLPSTSYVVAASGYNPISLTTGEGAGPLFALVYLPSGICKVTGTITGPDGKPQHTVTITANLNATGPIEGTSLILATAPSTTTDLNGHWELDLVPNALIEPKNTLYSFIFTQPAAAVQAYPFFSFGIPVKPHGPSVSFVAAVPNQSTVEFVALL